MSWKAQCQTCDLTWIFDDYPDPGVKIKQCKRCHTEGYPSRLIFQMAVHQIELKGYRSKDWDEERRCR